MPGHAIFILNVQHLDAFELQHIGDHGAVASPPKHLGTHHRCAPLSRQRQKMAQPAGEFLSAQVFGVSPKRRIPPRARARTGWRFSSASQFFYPYIRNTVILERGLERVGHVLRQSPRPRKPPYIRYCLYAVVLK